MAQRKHEPHKRDTAVQSCKKKLQTFPPVRCPTCKSDRDISEFDLLIFFVQCKVGKRILWQAPALMEHTLKCLSCKKTQPLGHTEDYVRDQVLYLVHNLQLSVADLPFRRVWEIRGNNVRSVR